MSAAMQAARARVRLRANAGAGWSPFLDGQKYGDGWECYAVARRKYRELLLLVAGA